MLFLLQLLRRNGVSTQPGIRDLLDNTEQDGDDDGSLEGLPENDEENWNGEHVRHDYFEDVAGGNDGVPGSGKMRAGERRRALGKAVGPARSVLNTSCVDPMA